MIIANSLDLIYAIGFNMQWQYILVDIILLSFLTIQQLQILNDRREKYLFIHTISIFLYLFLVIVMIYFTSLSNQILLWFGSISGVIYNLYWLPQIYKNYCQKQAEGFSIFYLVLSLISIICDINSAIFLGLAIGICNCL